MSSATYKNYTVFIPDVLFQDFNNGHLVAIRIPVNLEVAVGDKIIWAFGNERGIAGIVSQSDDVVRYRRTFTIKKVI